MCVCVCVFSHAFHLQADSLCSSDGVIIQTVTSDPASSSSEALSQQQLVVETETRGQDDRLDATSLLEGSESVVTETQEPMTNGFSDTDKVEASVFPHTLFACF